jgi:hypothetical protein
MTNPWDKSAANFTHQREKTLTMFVFCRYQELIKHQSTKAIDYVTNSSINLLRSFLWLQKYKMR